MESQTTIVYEIIDPVTNEKSYTYSREKALERYENTCMVHERHETICNPSLFTQSYMIVVRAWHNNPEFQEELYGY